MSELLEVAASLRNLDDESLHRLITRRQLTTSAKDFLDLAEAALEPKAIEFAIATLTQSEIQELQRLRSGDNDTTTTSITGLILAVERNGKTQLLAEAKSAADKLLAKLPSFEETTYSDFKSPDSDAQLLPLGAIAAFETQQSITEIVLDAAQNDLKVISRTAVASTDVKRIAAHLRKPLDFAKSSFNFAIQLGLIKPENSLWKLTAASQSWLQLDPLERWLKLLTLWRESLGKQAEIELASALTVTGELSKAFEQVFPLAAVALESHLAELSHQAQWLGLAVGDRPTKALFSLLSDGPQKAATCIQEFLPQAKDLLIAQGDQSLIAPGPLTTKTEIELRKFADVEQVSMASTYRLSALSLSRGLELGLTEAAIRELLLKLTQKQLPQPIDYLLKEASNKFAKITVAAGDRLHKSMVRAENSVTLTEIHTDQRLRHYAFEAVSASTLGSRFDPEIIYFGLRENGFLAVLLDSNQKIVPPQKSATLHGESEPATDSVLTLIQQLRANDLRIGSSPSDEDLLRQLQLAIKNKSAITVELNLKDGTTGTFSLVPSGLANGRLRGLDSKADTERVLPLAQIARVEF